MPRVTRIYFDVVKLSGSAENWIDFFAVDHNKKPVVSTTDVPLVHLDLSLYIDWWNKWSDGPVFATYAVNVNHVNSSLMFVDEYRWNTAAHNSIITACCELD